MLIRPYLIFIVYFLSVFNVSADLLIKSPSQACELLSEVNLATRGWINEYDESYGCSSDYKEIGSGSPLANNLAYYVEGNIDSVFQVYLTLNINDKKSAGLAQKELITVSQLLCQRTTGSKLPQKLIDAIRKGKNESQKLGNATIEIERQNWPTGRGYEVKLIIK